MNVYAPPDSENTFFETLFNIIAHNRGESNVCVCVCVWAGGVVLKDICIQSALSEEGCLVVSRARSSF